MLSYKFLFDIAIILLSTKILSLISQKIKLPQVLGALLAGIILGPACLNILYETEFIKQLSELGVIVLMFIAGLETDLNEIKQSGKASLVIALLGMLIPLFGGFILASAFFPTSSADNSMMFLQNIFIGVILTATSVSITVETLRELGKLKTRTGNAILGAAILDDILGIIALTFITSLTNTDVSLLLVIFKIILFFLLCLIGGWIFASFVDGLMKYHNMDMRRFVILAFVFCLLLSFLAEGVFGVASLTGAYMSGVILSNTERKQYILNRFETLSYILLSPIFFASIGLSVVVPELNNTLIFFSFLLIIVAILSKLLGCFLGAKLSHYTDSESLIIGAGMVSRGEVALILASKGEAMGLLNSKFFGPIVIMVVTTTFLAPVLLKLIYNKLEK